jgi:hypothetical protein
MQLAPVRGMMDTSVIRLLNSFTTGKYTQPVLIFMAFARTLFVQFFFFFSHILPPTLLGDLANPSQFKRSRLGWKGKNIPVQKKFSAVPRFPEQKKKNTPKEN